MKYLNANNDSFNIKTIYSNDYKSKLAKQKIGQSYKKLTFLPAEFLLFISLYLETPDHLIHIYDYYSYKIEYIDNCLLPVWSNHYYRLMHRFISNKTVVTDIALIAILVNDKFEYGVYKDFLRLIDAPVSQGLTFIEALDVFYTKN